MLLGVTLFILLGELFLPLGFPICVEIGPRNIQWIQN